MSHPASRRIALAVILAVGGLLACSQDLSLPPTPPDLPDIDPVIDGLIRELDATARRHSSDPGPWVNLGMGYEAHGLLEPARRCYSYALGLRDDEPRWWYRLALTSAGQGDNDAAIEAVSRSIALEDQYAPAHWRLGLWLLEQEKFQAAEAAFRRAIAINPADQAAYWGLAQTLLASDQARLAAATLEPLLQSDTSQAYTHHLLGLAYRHLGRVADARRELELGRHGEPGWKDPWQQEADEYRQGFASLLKKAYRLSQAGEPGKAIVIYEELRHRQPENIAVLNNLGRIYFATGRSAEGLEAFQAALALAPDRTATHLNLAAAYQRQRQYDKALGHADQALALNPKLAQAHETRGIILMNAGETSSAIEALGQARRYGLRNPGIPVWIAQLQCDLQRCEDAIAILQEAAREDPTNDEVLIKLVGILQGEGRNEEARLWLGKAIALRPDDIWLKQRLVRLQRSGTGGSSAATDRDLPPAAETGR